jgi:hypothetical protein
MRFKQHVWRTLAGGLLATTGMATMSTSVGASGGAVHQQQPVSWHAQQLHPAGTGNSGQVAGAEASLVRNANGISYRINTTELLAGHAYTLWLVVVNNPAACDPSPCTAPDIINDPVTDSQVTYAAGHVVGGSGEGTFAGAVRTGPLDGWLSARSLEDPMKAEVHLVMNDHGPALAEHLPGMIHTYRGGCSNASPFPAVFPATALADGEPGPNTCLLYQAAIFLPVG